MTKKCRIGIIGAGRMADFHLTVLAAFPDAEIAALANRGDEKRQTEMCRKYGIGRHFTNYLDMLEEGGLDAVFIAVSVVDNFSVTKECLLRKIPCLIEKPPGLTSEDTQELLQLSEENQVLHMVGLQRRFSSHIREAIRLVKERGPVYSIAVEAPERFGEIKAKKKFPDEVLKRWSINNGIHLLDLFTLIGGPIEKVTASRRIWKEELHPDSLHALIEFENGAAGHYSSNWNSPGGWGVKIFGEGIRVDIEPMEKGRVFFSDGTSRDLTVEPIDLDFKHGLFAQNRMFIDAVLGKGPIQFPAATLKDALVAMQLAEKILGPQEILSDQNNLDGALR